MNEQDLTQWAHDPQRAGLFPYALFEPRYPHDGVGAALVVRGVLYFENAYAGPTREAIAECFDRYLTIAKDEMKWLWHNDKAAISVAKAKPMRRLAASLSEDDRFDFDYLSGKEPGDASFLEFHVKGLRGWQEKSGTWGYNMLSFSLPIDYCKAYPLAFSTLFLEFARRLQAVHGYGGHGVNLSFSGRTENESTEYFISKQLGPGIDIGDPGSLAVSKLKGKIKTVSWLTAISQSMLEQIGGVKVLRSELPRDWFAYYDYGVGIVIQAGPQPESGASDDRETPPDLPANYVLVDHALKDLIPTTVGALQRGTVSGDAPVYNTKEASDAWLRRFDVPEDQLLTYKAALLRLPRLQPQTTLADRL